MLLRSRVIAGSGSAANRMPIRAGFCACAGRAAATLAKARRARRLIRSPRSFDYVVGAGEQGGRDGEADRLGRLEVDQEGIASRFLERQVGGLGALQDSVDQGG